ncbi:hypothetical protein C8F01DRAFT_1177703 [Mycena amicta]|nr:hypothetical protein C8F01DRAFT_1177703 [Mycena amicta]
MSHPPSLEASAPLQNVATTSPTEAIVPHNLLRPQQLSKLSDSIRERAEIACAPDASVADIKEVARYLYKHASPADALHLLPFVYTILDPKYLPKKDEFRPPSAFVESVIWVLKALIDHQLLRPEPGKFPEDASIHLLPRIWKWIQFFHARLQLSPPEPTGEKHDQPRKLELPEKELCIMFLHLLLIPFTPSNQAVALLFSTPGFLRMLIRSWRFTADSKNPWTEATACYCMQRFLDDRRVTEPARLAEVLDGAGGSYEDLAKVLIVHFAARLPAVCVPGTVDNIAPRLFAVPLAFIDTLHAGAPDAYRRLVPRLIDLGLMRLVSMAIRLVADFKDRSQRANWIVEMMLQTFFPCFAFTGTTGKIIEVIESGLPQSLVKFVSGPVGEKFHPYFEAYFRKIFLPSVKSASMTIVDAFKKDFGALEELVKAPAFIKSKVFPTWKEFENAYRARLQIQSGVDSGAIGVLRMCENAQCGKIAPEAGFQRCSGCHSVYYCSAACQKVHWRKGGHKQQCKERAVLFSEGRVDEEAVFFDAGMTTGASQS